MITTLMLALVLSALGFFYHRQQRAVPMPPARNAKRVPDSAVAARMVPTPPRAAAVPRPAPAPRAPIPAAPAPAAASTPALEDLQWDGPAVAPLPVAAKPVSSPASAAGNDGALRRKIRDRYVAARFPCTASSSADLEDAERIIKAARLFFEEQQPDRAMELLDLAIEHSPAVESLRLAQLEITFLMRDALAYRTLALAFHAAHPKSTAWEQVMRLGRNLAPADRTFGDASQAVHAHYGPWPDTPNWIHASWDLTCEVLAADFHRAMKRNAPVRAAKEST